MFARRVRLLLKKICTKKEILNESKQSFFFVSALY